jgi:hypothetical protein
MTATHTLPPGALRQRTTPLTMPAAEFRAAGHALVDLVADRLARISEGPVIGQRLAGRSEGPARRRPRPAIEGGQRISW